MKVIVIGAGEIGYTIASKLASEGKDVIIIDTDNNILKRLIEGADVKIIKGSGSNPITLKYAGINESEILLALANLDETNLATCLVADIISPSTKKIARIRSNDFVPYYQKLKKNVPHLNTVINPDIEVVSTIEGFMEIPKAVEVVKLADGLIRFIGIRIYTNSTLIGVKFTNLTSNIKYSTFSIVAIVRNEKLIIPRNNDTIVSGDLVYFITEEKNLFKTISLFDPNSSYKPIKRVLIIGGGSIGYNLAKRLENRSISCKIIEKKAEKCKYLAERLDRTVILHGDGSDERLLREENINKIDLVVTLTNDEETNILLSLLVKRMGVKKTITQVSKFSYSSFMPTIGIEQVVSSRLSAINTILQHIRKGKILSAISIKNEEGEIMEAIALPTSDMVSKPLKKINFPKEAIIAGIIRNRKVIIPNGKSIIEPGDHVILFTKKEAIAKVEKILSVKLEYF